MSQNRTRVPGVDDRVNSPVVGDPYARKQGGSDFPKGTVVPGMNTGVGVQNSASSDEGGGKPVLGFLYSISRQGIGEFWPLHIGQNTIGSDFSCDVCLREATVSSNHATLIIQKDESEVFAYINDPGSSNGTKMNGKRIPPQTSTLLSNNVKIQIGQNYELVFILLDVESLGLKVSEKFIPLEGTAAAPNRGNRPHAPHFSSHAGQAPTQPTGNTSNYYQPSKPIIDATVGVNGKGINRGGTVLDTELNAV